MFLLVFDRFPFFLTAFSIFAHIIYSTNLRRFPFISLTSPSFIASCGTSLPANPFLPSNLCGQANPSPGADRPLPLLPVFLQLPSSAGTHVRPLLHDPPHHHALGRRDPVVRTGRCVLRDMCVARAVRAVCLDVGGGVGLADDGERWLGVDDVAAGRGYTASGDGEAGFCGCRGMGAGYGAGVGVDRRGWAVCRSVSVMVGCIVGE